MGFFYSFEKNCGKYFQIEKYLQCLVLIIAIRKKTSCFMIQYNTGGLKLSGIFFDLPCDASTSHETATRIRHRITVIILHKSAIQF